MAAYCIFDITEINNTAKMENYRQKVVAVVEQYGGRYVAVAGKFDIVEGNWQPVYPVILEFPSIEQAHRWYDSEEYRELKQIRLSATKSNAVFVEGLNSQQ